MADQSLWWRDGVIYQIYPRSFADTNGDGVGDLPGHLARLDYLGDLGIDAHLAVPIYPSPDVDFGYDITDYVAIDPRLAPWKTSTGWWSKPTGAASASSWTWS